MGRVAAVGGGAQARRLAIETGGLSTVGWQVGDSVAVSGVCLTLVDVAPGRFDATAKRSARTTLGRPTSAAAR
jgi:riboflavin synthase alpha subunit